MDELILRNFEERMIAKKNAQHHPCGRGGEHDGAHRRHVKIARDFFECEEDGGQRSIECGSDRSRRSYGDEGFTCSVRKPSKRPSTEPMPAPTCTDGPSRPSGMPLASVAEVQKNLPNTVRRVMRPSLANNAALVCGTPLPRALGNNR